MAASRAVVDPVQRFNRGTEEVDAALLRQIEAWRQSLARNFALRNPDLDARGLNLAVQEAIGRIIFLRMCEARGLESDHRLQAIGNGPACYRRLCELFQQADDRTLNLALDDKPLQDILKSIYHPRSPFECSVLSVEILGQLYEQFLGKVIRLTSDREVAIEEKPEVKKAGGVYYTPGYIVEAIVRRTVGKLVEGKSPRQVAKLRVLDPACGCGSFLVGAYGFLLDWHRDWYVDDGPDKHAKQIYQGRDAIWHLTTPEKKRILLHNIYGVDLDAQAVEVTKLSLLLKMLEGEPGEGRERERLVAPNGHAGSDMSSNIKHGNSLIGSDFYHQHQVDRLERAEPCRINAFDWEDEFPEILKCKEPGFDAIIGNPPYGAALSRAERNYLKVRHGAGTTDTAPLMMLQAYSMTRNNGTNGFIVPKPFTYSSNWKCARDKLLGELTEIIDVGKVWPKVKLEQVVYILDNSRSTTHYQSYRRRGTAFVHRADIAKSDCHQFGFVLNGISGAQIAIARKILAKSVLLGTIATNERGGMFQASVNQQGIGLRVIGGKQLQGYALHGQKGWLDAAVALDQKSRPRAGTILVQNIVAHRTKPVDHIQLMGTIVDAKEAQAIAVLDTVNKIVMRSQYLPKFVLGVLLSRPLNWYVYRFIFAKAIRTMHFDAPVSDRLPIPALRTDLGWMKLHDRLVALVDELRSAPFKSDAAVAVERQIDRVVGALYGLNDEEIAQIDADFASRSSRPKCEELC